MPSGKSLRERIDSCPNARTALRAAVLAALLTIPSANQISVEPARQTGQPENQKVSVTPVAIDDALASIIPEVEIPPAGTIKIPHAFGDKNEGHLICHIDRRTGKPVIRTDKNPVIAGGLKPAKKKSHTTRIGEIIKLRSIERGFDPLLAKAVAKAESGLDPLAESPQGALGLMQLMPATAYRLGIKNPFDPRQNADGGIRYLQQLIAELGSVKEALIFYNAGESGLRRYRKTGHLSKETRNFLAKVEKNYRIELASIQPEPLKYRGAKEFPFQDLRDSSRGRLGPNLWIPKPAKPQPRINFFERRTG
ncbi:MAG: lytic transglycosylase domain-containing protein [Patescibacteria group bacterium]